MKSLGKASAAAGRPRSDPPAAPAAAGSAATDRAAAAPGPPAARRRGRVLGQGGHAPPRRRHRRGATHGSGACGSTSLALAHALVARAIEGREGALDPAQVRAVRAQPVGTPVLGALAMPVSSARAARSRPRKATMSSWSMPSPETPMPPTRVCRGRSARRRRRSAGRSGGGRAGRRRRRAGAAASHEADMREEAVEDEVELQAGVEGAPLREGAAERAVARAVGAVRVERSGEVPDRAGGESAPSRSSGRPTKRCMLRK